MNSLSLLKDFKQADGPISGDIRLAVLRLGEIVPKLPDEKILEGRAIVYALVETCVRVHGLEKASYLKERADV